MEKNSTVLVIGGDKRLFYLAEKLEDTFIKVMTNGLTGSKDSVKPKSINSLWEMLSEADVVVTPIPFTRDKESLFTDGKVTINIEEFIRHLYPNQILFGGNIPEDVVKRAAGREVICHDFMKMEQVAVDNALTTAEGAVAEAIGLSVYNIHANPCFVLGYGRCGKAIAKALDALGADVTVAARSKAALLEAAIQGYHTVPLNRIKEKVDKAVFIFNTIPDMILTKPIIETLNKEAIIIDIASAPGGTDFAACEAMGITAKLSLGIPGRFSPKTSADILYRAILNKLDCQ